MIYEALPNGELRSRQNEVLDRALLRLHLLEILNMYRSEDLIIELVIDHGYSEVEIEQAIQSLVDHREAVRPSPGKIILTPNGLQQVVSRQMAGFIIDRGQQDSWE